jgi:hypothetical protein
VRRAARGSYQHSHSHSHSHSLKRQRRLTGQVGLAEDAEAFAGQHGPAAIVVVEV